MMLLFWEEAWATKDTSLEAAGRPRTISRVTFQEMPKIILELPQKAHKMQNLKVEPYPRRKALERQEKCQRKVRISNRF